MCVVFWFLKKWIDWGIDNTLQTIEAMSSKTNLKPNMKLITEYKFYTILFKKRNNEKAYFYNSWLLRQFEQTYKV